MNEDDVLKDIGISAEDSVLSDLGITSEQQDVVTDYMKRDEMSSPEAFLEGASQGATFSFKDELGGALGAATEAGLGAVGVGPSADKSLKDVTRSLPDLYKEYRDLHRQRYEKATEDAPYSTLAGEFAGGFAVPAGIFSKAAKLPETATISQKIAAGAKVGLPAGMLTGAGLSEEPVMSSEFATDVGIGGGIGTGIGAGFPIAVAAGSKALDVGSSLVSPFLRGRRLGLEGINVVGEKAEKDIQQANIDFAKSFSKDYTEQLSDIVSKKHN